MLHAVPDSHCCMMLLTHSTVRCVLSLTELCLPTGIARQQRSQFCLLTRGAGWQEHSSCVGTTCRPGGDCHLLDPPAPNHSTSRIQYCCYHLRKLSANQHHSPYAIYVTQFADTQPPSVALAADCTHALRISCRSLLLQQLCRSNSVPRSLFVSTMSVWT